jgi:hypothetical protein
MVPQLSCTESAFAGHCGTESLYVSGQIGRDLKNPKSAIVPDAVQRGGEPRGEPWGEPLIEPR